MLQQQTLPSYIAPSLHESLKEGLEAFAPRLFEILHCQFNYKDELPFVHCPYCSHIGFKQGDNPCKYTVLYSEDYLKISNLEEESIIATHFGDKGRIKRICDQLEKIRSRPLYNSFVDEGFYEKIISFDLNILNRTLKKLSDSRRIENIITKLESSGIINVENIPFKKPPNISNSLEKAGLPPPKKNKERHVYIQELIKKRSDIVEKIVAELLSFYSQIKPRLEPLKSLATQISDLMSYQQLIRIQKRDGITFFTDFEYRVKKERIEHERKYEEKPTAKFPLTTFFKYFNPYQQLRSLHNRKTQIETSIKMLYRRLDKIEKTVINLDKIEGLLAEHSIEGLKKISNYQALKTTIQGTIDKLELEKQRIILRDRTKPMEKQKYESSKERRKAEKKQQLYNWLRSVDTQQIGKSLDRVWKIQRVLNRLESRLLTVDAEVKNNFYTPMEKIPLVEENSRVVEDRQSNILDTYFSQQNIV